METAAEGDDDAAIRRPALRGGPTTDQLDRRFIGFGAGVAQENTRGEARGHDQFLGQAQRRFAVEHVAGVPQLAGLFGQRRDQIGVVMAQPAHGDAGGKIDVLLTVAVPDLRALAALQDHFARTVDRKVVMLAGGEQFGGIGHLVRIPGGQEVKRIWSAGKASITGPKLLISGSVALWWVRICVAVACGLSWVVCASAARITA